MARATVGSLGERIRSLREQTDLTPAQLVKLAGLKGRGHVGVLEGGAEGVNARTLAQIGAVFGVTLDWLYLGEGKQPRRSDVRSAVARARRRLDARKSGAAHAEHLGTD